MLNDVAYSSFQVTNVTSRFKEMKKNLENMELQKASGTVGKHIPIKKAEFGLAYVEKYQGPIFLGKAFKKLSLDNSYVCNWTPKWDATLEAYLLYAYCNQDLN